MHVRAFLHLAIPFAALSLPALAGATIMVPLSIEEMAKEATCIARAQVIEQSARWDDDHRHIFTHTTLDVVETLHGAARAGSRIVIRSIGGEVGDVGMAVPGTPKFAANEEVIVFLRPDPQIASAFQVIGMSQGKYKLRREADGREVAVPGVEGVAFARASADGVMRVDPNEAGPGEIALSAMRQKIAAALAAPPAGLQTAPKPAAPARPRTTVRPPSTGTR